MIAVATWVAAVPIEIGRDEARELARRELSSPRYAEESSWIRTALAWIWERILGLIDVASGGTTGRIVIAVVAAALIAGIVVIVRRARPDARGRAEQDAAIFGDRKLTADDYRAAADAGRAAGDWSTAVIERFRAVAAELEEGGVVEPLIGRTADELAREVGMAMPEIRADLHDASALFDGVRYGGYHASADDHRRLDDLDRSLRRRSRRFGPATMLANHEAPR